MSAATETTSWAEATIASLLARGHRNSGARRAVVELLGRQRCCLTAQEIFDQLRAVGRRVGIASGYCAHAQLRKDSNRPPLDTGSGTTRTTPVYAGGQPHPPPPN